MQGQIIDTFQRTEIKYRIPKEKIDLFLALMDPYIQLDEYGLTTICNIYYDTENSDLVIRSLEKPDYKEKLRLRTYGVPDEKSMAFVELKKKFDGVVYKRRAAIPLRQAEVFLNQGLRAFPRTQIVRELEYFRDCMETGEFPLAEQPAENDSGNDPCRYCKYGEICGKQIEEDGD